MAGDIGTDCPKGSSGANSGTPTAWHCAHWSTAVAPFGELSGSAGGAGCGGAEVSAGPPVDPAPSSASDMRGMVPRRPKKIGW